MRMTETSLDPLIWFDLGALSDEWLHTSSRVLKRNMVKQGYDKIMSLYGAVRNKTDNSLMGVRIEILSFEEYSAEDLWIIYNYFKTYPFQIKYSIWIYEREHVRIECMGVYP